MQVHVHLANLIVTQQSGLTPLHRAAMNGNAEVVNALLTAGSKVDEKSKVNMVWKYEIEVCILHACIHSMATMPMNIKAK